MFKSTTEYNRAVCSVLKNIRDNGSLDSCGMDDTDYGDVLEYIEHNQLALGFTGARNAAGGYMYDRYSEVRPTLNGLAFIERVGRD